jgi:hypothetical protein
VAEFKESFVVTELGKTERDKVDERKVTYKAVLESKIGIKVVVTSLEPLELKKKDELELRAVKFQKTMKEKE